MVLLHMIPHGLTIFHTKRDSTQTYVSSFPIGRTNHTASTHVFCKRDSTWVMTSHAKWDSI